MSLAHGARGSAGGGDVISTMPDDWIDARSAATKLSERLREVIQGNDPAPWFDPPGADYEAFSLGKESDEYRNTQKFNERFLLTLQRAMLSGKLEASFCIGGDICRAPPSAFARKSVVRDIFTSGIVAIDPLWPDEWQAWNRCELVFPAEQFHSWLASDIAVNAGELPELPVPSGDSIVPIRSRSPSVGDRVSLSEAVSFLAFGIALNASRLSRALGWNALCGSDLQKAQRQLENAAASLTTAGANRQVSFFGRKIVGPDEAQHTGEITSLELDDYRQFLITGDRLFYGEGLKEWHRAPNDFHEWISERRDYYYSNVSVNRDELLKAFDNARADGKQRSAGRPNRNKEAIELHAERCRVGSNLTAHAEEARAIEKILADRHKSELDWLYKAGSIQRALRAHRSKAKSE